jgi:predicted nucleic acid-binding protein
VKAILVDSSFLLAMVDRDDKHHNEVIAFLKELGIATLLVTSHIFDEAMTLIKSRLGSEIAVRTGQKLRLRGMTKPPGRSLASTQTRTGAILTALVWL